MSPSSCHLPATRYYYYIAKPRPKLVAFSEKKKTDKQIWFPGNFCEIYLFILSQKVGLFYYGFDFWEVNIAPEMLGFLLLRMQIKLRGVP